MKKILMAFIVICSMVGCENPVQIQADNVHELQTGGEIIGTLPDGRQIRRYKICKQYSQPHWLYIVDKIVTVNRSERIGKNVHQHTAIFINE